MALFFSCLVWAAMLTGPLLVGCSVLLAFQTQLSTLLRFGPLFTLGAFLSVAFLQRFVLGPTPFLALPIGGFGCFLGVRSLACSLWFARLFAGCSLVFWPIFLFAFTRYLVLVYL